MDTSNAYPGSWGWGGPTRSGVGGRSRIGYAVGAVLALGLATTACSDGPAIGRAATSPDVLLSSWADGPTRNAIVEFVERVTDPTSPDFIEPSERIATFDNDGTLWSEKPLYVQLAFAIDRVRALAPEHPAWRMQQPFRGIIEGDIDAVAAGGNRAVADLLSATHAGMTTAEFERDVADWIATAVHPDYDRPYTDLAYAPMVELLGYLRANGFRTYIVSGGGAGFMRAWTERVYGIPPEQVIGSTIRTEFDIVDSVPVLRRLPEIDHIDDGPGKPVSIDRYIGRRPVMAVGNSDGDLQMLQWSAARDGPSLQLIVHHTDGEREVAYDRNSPIGTLDEALDVARVEGWVLIDVAADWLTVFDFQRPAGGG